MQTVALLKSLLLSGRNLKISAGLLSLDHNLLRNASHRPIFPSKSSVAIQPALCHPPQALMQGNSCTGRVYQMRGNLRLSVMDTAY